MNIIQLKTSRTAPAYIGLLALLILISACLKGPKELPQAYGSDEWSKDLNYDLGKLTELFPPEGAPIKIDSNYTLVACIRADDQSGNFSHKLVLEDSLAGISLLINENSLYTRFPIGRRVYLKLKGLYLANRRGTLELGSTPAADNSGILQVSEIPAQYINQHLSAGKDNWALPHLNLDIKTLQTDPNKYINRLILLSEIQLDNPYTDDIYALPTSALSIKLRQCNGDSLWLRSSNFSVFQPYATPKGKGSIKGILSNFGGSLQLAIRDTNDLQMPNNRCDGSPISAPSELSIAQVRLMHQGRDTIISNFYTYGVVTSHPAEKNFSDNTVVIQQGQHGIVLYLSGPINSPISLGDSVRINISGASLIRYQGVLEISNLKPSRISVLAKGKNVTPLLLNIAQLNLGFAEYESVLVRVNNAKITSGGFYSGSKTLSDATGNIILYTSSAATFAGWAVPSITKNFQGIATYYNETKEIKMRHPDIDVQ